MSYIFRGARSGYVVESATLSARLLPRQRKGGHCDLLVMLEANQVKHVAPRVSHRERACRRYHIESERAMRPAHEWLFEVEAAVFGDGAWSMEHGGCGTDQGTLLRLWFPGLASFSVCECSKDDADDAEDAGTTSN